MGHDTNDGGRLPETAVVYDAGERRTHGQHAAEAYDFAQRADALRDMGPLTELTAAYCEGRAQWHATMAVYEALVLPGYGMSVGDQLEHERENQQR